MSEASVREFVLTATATEITNLIEQQAKELAECQARVVVLTDFVRLVGTHFVDPSSFTPEMLHTAKFNEFLAHIERADNEIRARCKELLASTDTAAQTPREKHYEECAVICDKHYQEYSDAHNEKTTLYIEGIERGYEKAAQDIRAAAKEKP